MDILIIGILFAVISKIANKKANDAKNKKRYTPPEEPIYTPPIETYDDFAHADVHTTSTPMAPSSQVNTASLFCANEISPIVKESPSASVPPAPILKEEKQQVHTPVPLFSNPSECVKAVIYSEIMTPKFKR